MNPLAWWIDYYVGAVSTSASRLELWSLLMLSQASDKAGDKQGDAT